ncbi:hypothetical protein N656DRAFT_797588 [Canariomyces notabilis]|uniref:Mid2 domain-containing protein n=1 Tax=Canariomyces notabilis TaxID=2074819 RepID=A0AAN6YSS5_9PEZI|nr:hypothetical protein N656DRAFT_797588 [Canariomyces arenarius]
MAVMSLCRLNLMAVAAWLPAVSAQLGREHPKPWTAAMQTPAPEIFKADIGFVSAPALTARPHPRDVFQKRQSGDKTCGYVDGDAASAYVCKHTEAVCRYNEDASAVGCCLTEDCNIYTACLPYSSSRQSSTLNMDRTRYCSDSLQPSCATLVYMDDTWSGYTVPSCDSVATTYQFYITPTNGVSTTSSRSSRSSRSSSTESSTSETESSSTQSRSGATENPDPGPVAQESSSTPIGPIVGGVVGGVALLALIALGVFLLIRKKRNQNPPSPPGPPLNPGMYPNQSPHSGMAAMANVPPGPGGSPGPQFMDPRYSVAAPSTMAGMPHQGQAQQGQGPISPATSPSPSPSPMFPSSHSPSMMSSVPPGHPGHQSMYGMQAQPGQPMMQQNGAYQAPQQQNGQYMAYQPPPMQQQQHVNAAELPTQKGDGQLHELS